MYSACDGNQNEKTDGKIAMSFSLVPAKELGITVHRVNVRLEGPSNSEMDLTLSDDNTTAEGELTGLPPGTYTVFLTLYNVDSDTVGFGSDDIEVKAGEITDVDMNITLYSTTGGIRFNITWNTGGPKLPAVPYDYAGAIANMPAYLKNYLTANPTVDNTPNDNLLTNDGATLGRVLFYDKAMSVNNTISCGSCHHQDKAFVDGGAVSTGFEGGHTRRNSMPLTNVRFFKAKAMFWDMRAVTLETQALLPITDPVEMGMPSLEALVDKLKTKPYYPALFEKAFGTQDITADRISKALAQFLRSIVSFNSKYDQGLDNNLANLTDQEKNGLLSFQQLNCVECHSDLSTIFPRKNPTMFIVENSGLNTGFGSNNALDVTYADNGIGERTNEAKDMGTFKMPALRNIELTAPYMHDGRFATLEDVLDHYQTGAKNHPNRGIQIPSGGYGTSVLTEQKKADIIAFLKTLTDQSFINDPKYSDPFK
ncbi:cytochrome-c peroxidase [bacterium]|nr:cytochrome-c peroxidase [bacterium]